jgi:hypothetical protein
MDNGTRTRRFVRWLKDKIEQRQNGRDDHDPWWVTLMLDVGRPVVAIMILTMCAPGEHYLMLQARFVDPFAWLGPGTLTAYAGIAAVTATKRPKGSPGHRTAVTGAILSIGLAMAAQPIAHLWGQKGLDLQHVILICVVSSVPSAVFGHLLHMGAAPSAKRRTPKTDKRTDRKPDKTAPAWVTEEKARRTVSGETPGQAPDMATWTGHAETDAANRTPDTVDRTPDIGRGSPASDVRQYLTDHPDAPNDDLYEAMRKLHPGTPDNTFYVARKRFEKGRAS